jgi:hypothetical protein
MVIMDILLSAVKLVAQPNGFVQAYDSMHQVLSQYYLFTK